MWKRRGSRRRASKSIWKRPKRSDGNCGCAGSAVSSSSTSSIWRPARISGACWMRSRRPRQRPRPGQILGMSEFGLVEMTRKRVRDPLAKRMTEDCRRCDGHGRRKTVETVAARNLAPDRKRCCGGAGEDRCRARGSRDGALAGGARRRSPHTVAPARRQPAEADDPYRAKARELPGRN